MARQFVTIFSESIDQRGIAQHVLADKKKSRTRTAFLEDRRYLSGMQRMRTIVERQCNPSTGLVLTEYGKGCKKKAFDQVSEGHFLDNRGRGQGEL